MQTKQQWSLNSRYEPKLFNMNIHISNNILKNCSPSQDIAGEYKVIDCTIHRQAPCINVENQNRTLPPTIIVLAYCLNTEIAGKAPHLIRKVNRKKLKIIARAHFNTWLVLPKVLPPITFWLWMNPIQCKEVINRRRLCNSCTKWNWNQHCRIISANVEQHAPSHGVIELKF